MTTPLDTSSYAEHVTAPFYYLFRLNSQKILNVLDLEDALLLAKETTKAFQSEFKNTIICELLVREYVDFQTCTLYRHFDLDHNSSAKFNFEVRTVLKVAESIISGWEGQTIDEIPLSFYDNVVERMYDVYAETEEYTDSVDIEIARSTLSKMVPSSAIKTDVEDITSKDHLIDESMKKVIENILFS